MSEHTKRTDPHAAAIGHGDEEWGPEGLTKREYFATQAMQGLLANSHHEMVDTQLSLPPSTLADEAVEYADALIDALNAGGDER